MTASSIQRAAGCPVSVLGAVAFSEAASRSPQPGLTVTQVIDCNLLTIGPEGQQLTVAGTTVELRTFATQLTAALPILPSMPPVQVDGHLVVSAFCQPYPDLAESSAATWVVIVHRPGRPLPRGANPLTEPDYQVCRVRLEYGENAEASWQVIPGSSLDPARWTVAALTFAHMAKLAAMPPED